MIVDGGGVDYLCVFAPHLMTGSGYGGESRAEGDHTITF